MTAADIRALRARLKLTQLELALLLETSPHTVSCWENGRHKPHRHFRRRLAEIAKTYATVSEQT